jgi:hypothetical protein
MPVPDFNRLLKKHIPALAACVSENVINKAKIKYTQRVNTLKMLVDAGEVLHKNYSKPHCLFDVLSLAKEDERSAGLANFINHTLEDLSNKLDDTFFCVVKKKAAELVNSIDSKENPLKQGNNSTFENHLAELAGLNRMIDYPDFTLIGIDEKFEIPNSKKDADFVFQDNQGQKIHIDFVSHHNIDFRTIKTGKQLYESLSDKVHKKAESKIKGVGTNEIIENEEFSIFMILIVIWEEAEYLTKYPEVFVALQEKYGLPPCTLLPHKDINGKISYSFETVPNVLNRWKEDHGE